MLLQIVIIAKEKKKNRIWKYWSNNLYVKLRTKQTRRWRN